MPPRYRARRFRRPMRRRFPVPRSRSRLIHSHGTDVTMGAAGEKVHSISVGTSGTISNMRNLHGMVSLHGINSTDFTRGYLAFVKLTQAEGDYLTNAEIGNLADSSTDASRFFGVTPFAYQGNQALYLPMSFRSASQGAGQDIWLIAEVTNAGGSVTLEWSFTFRERTRDI